jgi:hypothetical protein
MGWNDRLPEDPYWPEQNEDRDSYENWCAYIEYQFLKSQQSPSAGLTSQNVDPAEFLRRTAIQQEQKNQTHEQTNARESGVPLEDPTNHT